MTDEDKVFRHESYGMIGFSRVTGNPGRLFGSALPSHGTFIVMKLSRATRRHDLSRDWFHADELIAEVMLSPVQFAELLTSMNVGDGVPCTIECLWENGKYRRMERPPADETTEAEEIQVGFEEKLAGLGKTLDDQMRSVKTILAKPTLTKKDRQAIQWAFEHVAMEVKSNMPFVLKSFGKATQKMAAAAKAEVDAFLTHSIVKLGLKAAKDGALLLPEPNIERDK